MKRYPLLLLLGIITLFSCNPQKQFYSYWNANTNNQLDDKKSAIFFQYEDDFAIKVFNNRNNIDVILETNSPNTLQKIYNLGLTLWIDPHAKQHHVFGVNFPMPAEKPFTSNEFKLYLQHFNRLKLPQEFADRFTTYETIDTRTQEYTTYRTLTANNMVRVKTTSTQQVLFKYRLTVPLQLLYGENIPQNAAVSIGVASVNEPDAEYYSALSSKQVIQKNLEKLKVNHQKNRQDLTEWWCDFILAH